MSYYDAVLEDSISKFMICHQAMHWNSKCVIEKWWLYAERFVSPLLYVLRICPDGEIGFPVLSILYPFLKAYSITLFPVDIRTSQCC